MSISDHGPVGPTYAPATDDELFALSTDAELNQVIEQAVADRDVETLAAAWAEKQSIERALAESRWETFNRWMDREFFGGGS